MLMNFCQKSLETSTTCSTVSNDGYEVTNLTSDTDRGFLAYSCIKPPVHIDFALVCDVRVDHILVWPTVGAQKSSGFEISVKTNNDYRQVSTAFLGPEHSGVLFYRRDVASNCAKAPANFLPRYMRTGPERFLDRARNLRLSILRTDNSIPAIQRVEVWGRVSRSNTADTIARVHALWCRSDTRSAKVETTNNSKAHTGEAVGHSKEDGTSIPECYLDPITCSIMIQPIVLPSGAIIDQSTLEKHGKAEAIWGRPPSDPFTGITFSDSRKPVIASALKARIDKYLVDHEDLPEVKRLPRLSGLRQTPASMRNRALNMSEITTEAHLLRAPTDRELSRIDGTTNKSDKVAKKSTQVFQSKTQRETCAHRLPVISTCFKREATKIRLKTTKFKSLGVTTLRREIRPLQRQEYRDTCLDRSVNSVLSNLHRFDDPSERAAHRKCVKNCKCPSQIFYKLPCGHILCRDVLLSIEDSRCADCSAQYYSKDLQRIHGLLTM